MGGRKEVVHMNKSCLLPEEKLLGFYWEKQLIVCIFENGLGQFFAGPVFELKHKSDEKDNVTGISLRFEWLIAATLMLLPVTDDTQEKRGETLSPDLRSKKELNALRQFNEITLKNDKIANRIICEYTPDHGGRARLTLSMSPLHVGNVIALGEKYDFKKS